jgi:hypothetical protein
MDAKQFYEVLPDGRYRFRVDHHTINSFNTCDRYFSYRHMVDSDGKVWGGKNSNLKMVIGSWWSTVMESFYNEMAHGVMPTTHHMFKFVSEAWMEHDVQLYGTLSDEKTREVFEKFGGLDGARQMALEYYEAFAKQHFAAWTVIGAEMGFGWKDEVFLGEDDRVVVYYGGKPDLVIYDRAQNMVMPLDFKTKDSVPGNASVLYKPHPQTAGYIFALRELMKHIVQQKKEGGVFIESGLTLPPTKCQIMVCARFRPTDKPRSGVRAPRFAPVYVSYSESEIEEWRVSVMEKCRRLRDSIEREYFPPRESACHLFYHGCMFRRICSQPAAIRPALLKADFTKMEPWSPYSVEED